MRFFVASLLILPFCSSSQAQNQRARELGLHIGVMAPGTEALPLEKVKAILKKYNRIK